MSPEQSLKVRDHLPAAHPKHIIATFSEILEDANLNAKSEREIDFVAKIQDRWDRYGEDSYLTNAQFQWLCKLARYEV